MCLTAHNDCSGENMISVQTVIVIQGDSRFYVYPSSLLIVSSLSFSRFAHTDRSSEACSVHLKEQGPSLEIYIPSTHLVVALSLSNVNAMHPVPLINHPCTLCGRATSMWCSRCQSAWYCSPEHIHSVSFVAHASCRLN